MDGLSLVSAHEVLRRQWGPSQAYIIQPLLERQSNNGGVSLISFGDFLDPVGVSYRPSENKLLDCSTAPRMRRMVSATGDGHYEWRC